MQPLLGRQQVVQVNDGGLEVFHVVSQVSHLLIESVQEGMMLVAI